MQLLTSRYLDFGNGIRDKYVDFGYSYDSVALLFLQEERESDSHGFDGNSYTTNVTQIQNLKQYNYLVQKNLSFLTNRLETVIMKQEYPKVEAQIYQVIKSQMAEISDRVLEKVSKEYYEKLVLGMENNTTNITQLLEQELSAETTITKSFQTRLEKVVRQIENIEQSIYIENKTLEKYTEQKQEYKTLLQNAETTRESAPQASEPVINRFALLHQIKEQNNIVNKNSTYQNVSNVTAVTNETENYLPLAYRESVPQDEGVINSESVQAAHADIAEQVRSRSNRQSEPAAEGVQDRQKTQQVKGNTHIHTQQMVNQIQNRTQLQTVTNNSQITQNAQTNIQENTLQFRRDSVSMLYETSQMDQVWNEQVETLLARQTELTRETEFQTKLLQEKVHEIVREQLDEAVTAGKEDASRQADSQSRQTTPATPILEHVQEAGRRAETARANEITNNTVFVEQMLQSVERSFSATKQYHKKYQNVKNQTLQILNQYIENKITKEEAKTEITRLIKSYSHSLVREIEKSGAAGENLVMNILTKNAPGQMLQKQLQHTMIYEQSDRDGQTQQVSAQQTTQQSEAKTPQKRGEGKDSAAEQATKSITLRQLIKAEGDRLVFRDQPTEKQVTSRELLKEIHNNEKLLFDKELLSIVKEITGQEQTTNLQSNTQIHNTVNQSVHSSRHQNDVNQQFKVNVLNQSMNNYMTLPKTTLVFAKDQPLTGEDASYVQERIYQSETFVLPAQMQMMAQSAQSAPLKAMPQMQFIYGQQNVEPESGEKAREAEKKRAKELVNDIEFVKETTQKVTKEIEQVHDISFETIKENIASDAVPAKGQQKGKDQFEIDQVVKDTVEKKMSESVNQITNQVYHKLEQRLKSERSRRGM